MIADAARGFFHALLYLVLTLGFGAWLMRIL